MFKVFVKQKRSLSCDDGDDAVVAAAPPPAANRRKLLAVAALVGACAAGVLRLTRRPLAARPRAVATAGVAPAADRVATCVLDTRPTDGPLSRVFGARGAAPPVADDVVVSVATVPARRDALPIMLRSLSRGATLPRAVFVVGARRPPGAASERRRRHRSTAARRPSAATWRRRGSAAAARVSRSISCARPTTADPSRSTSARWPRSATSIPPHPSTSSSSTTTTSAFFFRDGRLVARPALLRRRYDARVVEFYARALRSRPRTAFTVQSPPAHLRFAAAFPVAYGSRGVGVRLGELDDLAAFAAAAARTEPTCRVVDDIVVSAFLHARRVRVADVPGFSFKHRPWRRNRDVHDASKSGRLRSANRTLENVRCHDALVNRTRRRAAA